MNIFSQFTFCNNKYTAKMANLYDVVAIMILITYFMLECLKIYEI